MISRKGFLSLLGALPLATVLTGCSFFGEQTVELTAGNAEVVVAADAAPVAKFAAAEMTNFLSQAFGRAVPLVAKPSPGKVAVEIGGRGEGLAPDAYRLTVRGNRIGIVGRDDPKVDPAQRMRQPSYSCHCFDKGTLNGVYAFLERFAGCRFYFPGRLGEIVPRTNRIVVPEQDAVDAPDMTVRTWSFFSDGKWPGAANAAEGNRLKALNLFRQRATGGGFACCHGLNGFKYKERFFKTHPEYFALAADGKTRGVNLCGQDGQLCFTSAVTNEIFKDCLSYLKGEPASVRGIPGQKPGTFAWGYNCTKDYIDIMPQDGMMRCHCKNCEAAYDKGDGRNYATSLVWGYTDAIAKRLKAEGFEPKLQQMAYTPYRQLPSFHLSTNISVMVAETGPYSICNAKSVERQRAEVAAWSERVGREVWMWTYPNKHECNHLKIPDIPCWCPRAWGRYYKTMAPHIYGGFCESECDRAVYNLLAYYVFSKLAWDKSVDTDALVDEFYAKMFGAAGEPMKRFGDLLEAKWTKEVAGAQRDTPLGPAADPPDDFRLWTGVYDEKTMAELGGLLKAAAAAVTDGSLESARVAFFRDEIYEPLRKVGDAFRETISVKRGLAWLKDHPDGNLLDWGKKGWGAGKFIDQKGPSGDKVYEITLAKDAKDTTSHDVIPFRSEIPLRPSSKYRLSYFVQLNGVKPTSLGGGIGPIMLTDRKDLKGRQRAFTFPPSMRFLAGTSDWIYQSFDFETDEHWEAGTKPTFYLRFRQATGTARFDAVRIDRIPAPAETTGVKVSERFGYDPVDSTRFLQAALDSKLPKIVVDRQKGPWVTKPLWGKSNQTVVFEDGVELVAKRGEFHGKTDILLEYHAATNVTLLGYGATLRMWKVDYTNAAKYAWSEWRHGLSFHSCSNVVVKGLSVVSSGGDGIYLGEAGSRGPNRDVVIRDVYCLGNNRQGISVITADGLLIENTVMNDTFGTPPASGIDFEPNGPEQYLTRIVMRHCTMENNQGFGLDFSKWLLDNSSPPMDILVESCHSARNGKIKSKGRVHLDPAASPFRDVRGLVTLRNCELLDGEQTPDMLRNLKRKPTSFILAVENCTVRDPAAKGGKTLMNETWPKLPFVDEGGESLGIIQAELPKNCKIIDRKPGQMVPVKAPYSRDGVVYQLCVAKPGPVHLKVVQRRVSKRPLSTAVATVTYGDGWNAKKVAELKAVGKDPEVWTFNAPKAGFYVLKVDYRPHAIGILETDVPIAVVNGGPRGHYNPSLVAVGGDLSFEVKEGTDRFVFVVAGGGGTERVNVTLSDPAGREAFASGDVGDFKAWTSPRKPTPGFWKVTCRRPTEGCFEDYSLDLAGIPVRFFLTPEKRWTDR